MATPQDALPAATVEKWTGLYKSVGRFAIPPGAMQDASNLVLPGPSLLTLRRGFESNSEAFGIRTDCLSMGFYGSLVCYIDSLGLSPPGFLVADAETFVGWGIYRQKSDLGFDAAALNAVGFQVPASTSYRRFFTSNGNLYISGLGFGLGRVPLPPTPTQNEGWSPAIMDKPVLVGGYSFVAGTFLPGSNITQNGVTYPNGSQVGYRATYRWVDGNGNIHRSQPSEKIVVTYTTNASNTAVRILVNETPMVVAGTIVELWRTKIAINQNDGSDSSGDECFKIAEVAITGNVNSATGYLVATGVGTPFASYDDNTPDVPYLNDPLYTNPTTGALNGLGIGNANVPPPASFDTFQFKGYTYYANTQEVQRAQIQIIGTGGGGIVDGDTFSVAGVNYMFKDAAPASAGYIFIQIWRTGSAHDKGSIIENIRFTAQAAADAICKGQGFYSPFFNTIPPNNPEVDKIRAFNVDVNGLPGYINLERLVPNGAQFTISPGTGAGRGWAGLLAVGNVSDPNRQPNALMQSQYNDPESVPPAFTETVGHEDSAILRGIPLRDTCLLYKSAPDGLWKFTDDGSGNLTISSLDATVNLIAPKTAVFLDNASFALCDKGVLKITDGGAPENISDEKLRLELADLVAHVGLDTIADVAFAVAYEAEKLYVLCLPEGPNSTDCTLQYVYNLTTDAWTTWDVPNVQSGGVDPYNGKLYLGRNAVVSGGQPIWRERKDNTDDDFQDPSLTATWAASQTTDTIVVTGDQRALPYNGFAQGDRVVYVTGGHSYLAWVNSVTYSGSANQTTIVFSASLPMVSGESFTLRKAIQCPFTLLPLVDGDPLFDKQWQDLYLYFRYCVNDRILISYGTNRQQVPNTYPLPGPLDTEWYDENLGWGELPWGGPAQDVILKLGLDQAASRSAELTLTIDMSRAGAGWQLSALRVPYLPTTQKVVR